MSTLIITRHAALVQYLVAKGYVPADATVVSHASPEVVKGKHVWGVLPHSLSCLTKSFTEVPMHLPASKRGVELTLEDMYEYAGVPQTYVVNTKEIQAHLLESCFHYGVNSCTPSINWLQEAIGES